jgi:hypothetical protein
MFTLTLSRSRERVGFFDGEPTGDLKITANAKININGPDDRVSL